MFYEVCSVSQQVCHFNDAHTVAGSVQLIGLSGLMGYQYLMYVLLSLLLLNLPCT